MKTFNTTGVCIPEKHYMVDISGQVNRIVEMVDRGAYFCMNRARQYGKTTTLYALRRALSARYQVAGIDFQGIGDAGFRTEEDFTQSFCALLLKEKAEGLVFPEKVDAGFQKISDPSQSGAKLSVLFDLLTEWCASSEKAIVLLIDEVDSATNNQVFLDFLAQLRKGYIDRDTKETPAFQAVVLAGVTDIKHLKGRIREEDRHKVNSPWNIAADFDVDMSLPEKGIAGMLSEYASDHRIEMDENLLARLIRDYTSGYPFLVSRICQLMDKNNVSGWTRAGVEEAVKELLLETNTLFDSLSGKLTNQPELKRMLCDLLLRGKPMSYNPLQNEVVQLEMYGFIRRSGAQAVVSNRIFETLLYNLFLDEEKENSRWYAEGDLDKNMFIADGHLNMRLVLERFVDTFEKIFGETGGHFAERDGRELFLLYLKPIINGVGNYYIEAQTRDRTRTDVVVDYRGEQFVVELKIWRGERYHERGEQQIREYLEYFGLDTGYMLSFNFNQKKETGVVRRDIGNKILYEGMV